MTQQMFDQRGPIVALASDRGSEIQLIPGCVYLLQCVTLLVINLGEPKSS